MATTMPPEYVTALAGSRVLVTGGAGFIGSSTVVRLVDIGARVTVLDDFFTGLHENLPPAGPGLMVVEGSVTDEVTVRDLVASADYVLHMAARNIIVSTKNPREDYAINIGGTLNILMAARDSAVRRVLYTSSASVYGNPRYLPINEDDATNMLSPYAVSKYGGENYCKAFFESYGVPVTSVRYSNVYGPMQRPENPYCGVVAKFFDAAMSGKPPVIHGDGEQTRDYTYIGDAVEATLLAAVSPGRRVRSTTSAPAARPRSTISPNPSSESPVRTSDRNISTGATSTTSAGECSTSRKPVENSGGPQKRPWGAGCGRPTIGSFASMDGGAPKARSGHRAPRLLVLDARAGGELPRDYAGADGRPAGRRDRHRPAGALPWRGIHR